MAVITGASIGIGLAVASALAEEGVNLVMAARQAERLEAEAKNIADRHGVKTVPVSCDVATAGGCQTLIDAVEVVRRGRHPDQQCRDPEATRRSSRRPTRSGSIIGSCM